MGGGASIVMASVNKVIILGHLGRDPDLRYTQNGDPVASLNVATTRKWFDKKANEKREETEWHRVSVFGNSADACGKYLTKGQQVYVEGRIRTRSYDDKDGVKKYSTEIVAEVVQFLGGKSDGGGQGGQRGGGYGGRGGGNSDGGDAYDPGAYSGGGGGHNGEDDDLPF